MSVNDKSEEKPKFEFYVLNYDPNARKVFSFNIFNNIGVRKETFKEVKKYLKNPKKYESQPLWGDTDSPKLYGFDAFCRELDSIIRWQEWGRREYEISVGDLFEEDLSKYEKWDCYQQAQPNIEIIARDVIYQYKESLKKAKEK